MEYKVTIVAKYENDKIREVEVSTNPDNEDDFPNEKLREILENALDEAKNLKKFFGR